MADFSVPVESRIVVNVLSFPNNNEMVGLIALQNALRGMEEKGHQIISILLKPSSCSMDFIVISRVNEVSE